LNTCVDDSLPAEAVQLKDEDGMFFLLVYC